MIKVYIQYILSLELLGHRAIGHCQEFVMTGHQDGSVKLLVLFMIPEC